MTSTTTHVEEAVAAVTENETRTHDLSERFTRARDQLSEMSAERDSRVTSSARFISVKATAGKLVEGLALELEEARADLIDAREIHKATLVAAYQAVLPEILDRRHELAGEADKLIASLNTTLKRIMELSNQEAKARDAAGQGGAGILRQDKIISGWVMSHIPALRSMRGPGSLTVYPMCRGDLAAIYSPYTEEEA